MEKSISCFLNQLVNAQLNPGYVEGANGTASDVFNMLPYMAIPLLLVLIGGLYCISLYRKREMQR